MANLFCIYGSVTGKAQSIAEQIVDSSLVPLSLHCFDELGATWSIDKKAVLVIVSSTTGDGEQPENVTKFWRKIRSRKLQSDHLQHIQYTILGLGDSNYNQFCQAPKTLHRRLSELGARVFYPPGWADDGIGLELVVEPWLDGLWPQILKLSTSLADDSSSLAHSSSPSPAISNTVSSSSFITSNIASKMSEINASESVATEMLANKFEEIEIGESVDKNKTCLKYSSALTDSALSLPVAPKPYIAITYGDVITKDDAGDVITKDDAGDVISKDDAGDVISKDDDSLNNIFQNGAPLPSSAGPVRTAEIVSVKSLTSADAVKKYLEVNLKLSEDDIFQYEAGDAVSVICENKQEEVDQMCELLGVSDKQHLTCHISIDPQTKKPKAKLPVFIPETSSLNQILRTCCDFRSVPKKPLLRALIDHTSSPGEKRRLQELCSKEGAEEYMEHIRLKDVHLLDLLTEFASCKPPVRLLLEQLPRLQPRPYSIACSPRKDPSMISFVVTVVGEPRPGLASSWMAELKEGDSVRVFPRTNCNFRAPSDLSVPYIMVSAGSGLGPFMGFISNRQKLMEEQNLAAPDVGEAWLFFGCRNKEKDFIYRREIEMFQESGVLSKFCVSFSRDDGNEGCKYVQDRMEMEGKEVWEWLGKKEGRLFVCGDAKNMAKGVNEALEKIVVKHGGMEEKEAKDFVAKMQIDKRYMQDIWT